MASSGTMNPDRSTPPTPRTLRPRRGITLALACALLLGGCGVRLDSPPPTEPVPDPVEIVRRTAVDDALLVAEQARLVQEREGTKKAVAEVLAHVEDDSAQHVAQLGGVYSSGLESRSTTPSPSASPTARPGPGRVLSTLTDAAARNATAADVCEDGELARLLASISASQRLAARELADATGEPRPSEARPTVPGTDAEQEATPGAEPTTPPAGLASEDLNSLVLAEDSAGYAFEVRAARTDDDGVRTRLLDRARVHRERAEDWAVVAEVSETEKDPRRSAYELPDGGLAPSDVVRQVENRLAANYASIVGLAEPGTRAAATVLLVDSAATLHAWGADVPPFPGLPEQSDQD